MQINPSEVTKILKEQIKKFGEKTETTEVGQVLSVGDGIARVYGLDNVQAGEMVEFSDGSYLYSKIILDVKFSVNSLWIFSNSLEDNSCDELS